ncbi:MAG TPA: PEP-CTERM sorting domain-containing protein [Tepidisphaeraceae bacterium]|nr:PEP-CTERM sorting domain-containing protein [Tepidisphaeraceae bacterium]
MSEQRSSSNYGYRAFGGHSQRTRSSAGARALALAAAGAVMGLTATAHAADIYWAGPAATEAAWETATNWSPALVPGSLDVARIDNGGIAVLSTNQSVAHVFPASTTSSGGTVRHTAGALTLSGHWIVGEGGSSNGRYEMSGAATMNVAGAMWVGSHGTGTLDIRDTASITGNSGHGFNVGTQTNGVGTVNMFGGSITSGSYLAIGHHHSARGTFNLHGGTVTAGNAVPPTNTTLIIGGNNTTQGVMNQSGGTFNVRGQVSLANTSDVVNSVYDLSGGTLNAFNDNADPTMDVSIRVGQAGAATMKVRGTGVANVGRHLIVGGNNATTGVGTLEVGGTSELNVGMGATNTAGILGIGANGVGISTQSGGVINTDFLLHGYVANTVSKGESTQTGGALNVSGNMHLGRSSAQNNFYNISGGTIDVGGNLTVAQLSNRTSAAPTDPWAGTVSKGTFTVSGTADVAVIGELSNSAGYTPTSGVNAGIAQPGGVGRIEMNGGTLTAGSFLNGAAANADSSHAGSGASAAYVQTGGTASVGHVTGTGTVSVSGGTMNVGSLRQSAVTVSGGVVQVAANGTDTGKSVVNSLGMSGSGKLDLTNNALDTMTPAATVRQYIIDGRGGAGGTPTWTGNGLTSSFAAANPNDRSLGYVDNAGTVTVKYTVAGDANLDGIVNVSDRAAYLGNAGQSNRNWSQADWNYDSITNVADRAIYLAHAGQSLESPSAVATGSVTTMDVTPGNAIPGVTYNSATGKLVLDTDGMGINAFLITVAQSNITSVVADPDGSLGASWSTYYVGNAQNWESQLFNASGNLTQGVWELATLVNGLTASSFGVATFYTEQGQQVDTTVNVVVPEPAALGMIGLAALGMLARRRRAV